jgi:hypothetical protein
MFHILGQNLKNVFAFHVLAEFFAQGFGFGMIVE